MDTMFDALSGQATLLLQSIRKCYETSAQSSKKDFKEFFFRVSNEIMAITYSKYELGLFMDADQNEKNTSGSRPSETSTSAASIDCTDSSSNGEPTGPSAVAALSVKNEADCAVANGENEMTTLTNADESAVICIADSSDEESADVKPKVEQMGGDDEIAAMEFQTNSEFDEYLDNPVEESRDEQVTGEISIVGDLIGTKSPQSASNNGNGSSPINIANGKQKPPTTGSVDKETLSKPGPSLKALEKSANAKPLKMRSKVGSTKPNRTQASKRSHQCEVCLKTFSCSSYLKRHRIVHARRQYRFHCVGCARGFEQEADKMAHDKVCEERRYECHICNEYATQRKADLQQHMRIHTGERPFRCNRCSKEFKHSSDFKRHQLVHVKRFKYRCVGCARGFKREADKMAHDKVCNKLRYECHICQEYATPLKTNLKIHMRKHTGEKPYRCEICMKYFTIKGNLKAHLDNFHK